MKSNLAMIVFIATALSPSAMFAQTASPRPGSGQAPRQGSGLALTLQQLEEIALKQNPTLVQAEAEVAANRGRALQAGLLPNPTVGYIGEEIKPGPIIRGGEHGLFAEQTIPLGGKLGLGRRVFEGATAAAEAAVAVQRQRVLNTVRMLFYEALAAQRRVEVRERLSQLASEAVTTSQQLYNTGAADRPDVLESEIEASQARLALDDAENARFKAWRRLAAAVGDPTLTIGPLVGDFDGPLPELDRAKALEAILRDSPEIKAARAAVDTSDLEIARARREPFPDLVLRGGTLYNRELLEVGPQGPRPVGWEGRAEVGLTIPLFNRNQGNVATARARLSQAQSEMTRLRLDLEQRLASAFEEYLSALRRAEEYRAEIVPRAQEAYRLYLDRYRAMAAAYPQVLIAQRTLFQVTEQYVTAVERTWQSAVQLQGFLLSGALRRPGTPETETRPDDIGKENNHE